MDRYIRRQIIDFPTFHIPVSFVIRKFVYIHINKICYAYLKVAKLLLTLNATIATVYL